MEILNQYLLQREIITYKLKQPFSKRSYRDRAYRKVLFDELDDLNYAILHLKRYLFG